MLVYFYQAKNRPRKKCSFKSLDDRPDPELVFRATMFPFLKPEFSRLGSRHFFEKVDGAKGAASIVQFCGPLPSIQGVNDMVCNILTHIA